MGLFIAALVPLASCSTLRVRFTPDVTSDVAIDVSRDLAIDDPALDGGVFPFDAGDVDALSDATFADGLMVDSPTGLDSAVDASVSASDASADERDAAVFDSAPPRSYRIDTSDAITLFGRPIGSGSLPAMQVGNRRTARCEPGIIATLIADSTTDPTDRSAVNRTLLLCSRLQADGSVVFDPLDPQPTLLNQEPIGVGFAPQVRVTDSCPRGFALVGFQGELSHLTFSGLWYVSRLSVLCAGLDAWAATHDPAPNVESAIFVSSRIGTTVDGGADAAAAAGDAGDAGGLVPLPNLVECTRTLRPTDAVAACALPMRGGRPASMMGQRSFFVTCPGGYLPTGYRAAAGYYIDALELHCSRLIAE